MFNSFYDQCSKFDAEGLRFIVARAWSLSTDIVSRNAATRLRLSVRSSKRSVAAYAAHAMEGDPDAEHALLETAFKTSLGALGGHPLYLMTMEESRP